jgi:mRNA-degrading endonuclease toxin of MazEF toxin-antitoxin module
LNDKRPALRYGRVVYAWIKDSRGFAKLRPALVLTPDDLIKADKPLVVAAITTRFPEPPPKNHVALPWNPRGNVSTKLHQRSAVVLDWQAEIKPDDVVALGGDVPGRKMLEIEERLDEIV